MSIVKTKQQTPPGTETPLQKVSGVCYTHRRRRLRLAVLYLSIIALGAAAAIWAYHHFQPVVFTRPDFDETAVAGAPQVEERYGYSALRVADDYTVKLCGVPANDGQTVEFYLTNPADNGVWFRAEVHSQAGDILGSTGVLRPGEHLPSITLSQPLTEQETPITIRVVAYEPDTWQSRGNVNLNLTLFKAFS